MEKNKSSNNNLSNSLVFGRWPQTKMKSVLNRIATSFLSGLQCLSPTSQQVPLNTILKPNLRGPKRSVTKLTDNEVLQKASKYCLTSQELDTDGEVETKLFKVSGAAIATILKSLNLNLSN